MQRENEGASVRNCICFKIINRTMLLFKRPILVPQMVLESKLKTYNKYFQLFVYLFVIATGLIGLILTALRAENKQKKTPQTKKIYKIYDVS